MKADYRQIIEATDTDRRDLFVTTAARLGTAVQHIEKDFWVCWALDVLFNGVPQPPRILFKGGTSLSKAFSLITRFSEDIDITVFREDLGQPVQVAELAALSGKKRRVRLEEVRQAAQAHIAGPMREQFEALVQNQMPAGRYRIELDLADRDNQTILFWYPAVTADDNAYIRSAVKIEAGAKSALDPHVTASITPYVANELAHLDLAVPNVTTVAPERTFWDKVIIAHGLRQWHGHRGEIRHGGQRVTRHYYDLHSMFELAKRSGWHLRDDLANDCATHADMFFGSPDLGLDQARRGSFTLAPTENMREALEKDYQAMSGMIFGEVPAFSKVITAVEELERLVNSESQ